MANKHATELRGLADEELATRYTETKAELFNLRFNLATGQLDNNSRIGQLRREVARLATLIREREIAAHEATEANA
jgi:large subunit ribosomal protein L29